MIRTDTGDVAVEDLAPGDAVLTRDNGFQILRWIGQCHLSADALSVQPHLRPIEIAPGALGPHQPSGPLRVSPQHRVLLHGFGGEMLYGESEVLVAAAHLLPWQGVRTARCAAVTYVHMLFDRHEIVLSGGAWTESFQPGERSLSGVDAAQRAELYALFPELRPADAVPAEPADPPRAGFVAARPTLKRHEAAILDPPPERR
jgi:hypothetical protein